jgi:subtilisin family serine protease
LTPSRIGGLATVTPEAVVPGRVLVGLAPHAAVADVAAAHGLRVRRAAPRDLFFVLEVPAGAERRTATALRSDARVAFAEPDYFRQPTAIDPRLWAFDNPGGLTISFSRGRNRGAPITAYQSLADADEDNVEGYATGGQKVFLGSIDTGVEFAHPEFASGQLVAGWDWYSDDPDPSDEDGHGTHTTGTMIGRTVGVAGIARAGQNVKVYVQRVCGPPGCPTSAIASAIIAAADYGVVAMNVSIGGTSNSEVEKAAILYAHTMGALVVCSAGNGGTAVVECPACNPLAISVAASNWRDELTYYSNWGPGLDLTAPGGEMYSNTTDESGIYSAYLKGGYAYMQGTSMAAPQVTGTAGIVASVTGLRGDELRQRIESSVDDLGSAGYDEVFGWGRLNSYRAVTGATLTEAVAAGM